MPNVKLLVLSLTDFAVCRDAARRAGSSAIADLLVYFVKGFLGVAYLRCS